MFTKHIIIPFLIVNILFSNLAWSVDECGYLFEQPNKVINTQFDDHLNNFLISKTDDLQKSNIPGEDIDKNACDINCSANVRLLFISFSLPFVHLTTIDSIFDSLESSFYSIQGQPPVKPPRV
jgi:hypothetical protein